MTVLTAVLATSASAATTGNWSFSLNGDGFGGSVRFSGTDQNNDGFLRSADGEVTDLFGIYDNGSSRSPGYAGISFDKTYSSISYLIDGVFGNNSSDFIKYSRSLIATCPVYEFGSDQNENLYNITKYRYFYFSGNSTFLEYDDEVMPRFSLSVKIGPQIVTGPVSALSPIPLPASSFALLSGFLGLLLFRKRRNFLQPSLCKYCIS